MILKHFINPPPWKQLLVGVVVVAFIFGLMSWRAACTRAEQAGDQATIADARTTSAQEAIEAIGDNAAADTITAAQVKEAQDAIDRETDPVERDRIARCELRKLQGLVPC